MCFPHRLFSRILPRTLVEHSREPWPQRQQCPFIASPSRFSDRLTTRNYTRGVIRPRFNHDHIDEPLLPPFRVQPKILRSEYAKKQAGYPKATIAHVVVHPDPKHDDTEKIRFGAATTVERLDEALPRIAYFIDGTKASMIALIPPVDNLDEKQTCSSSRGLGASAIRAPIHPTLFLSSARF